MAKANKNIISDELLSAYLEGNTTPEETMQVLHALEHDEHLREILITAERVDSMLENDKPEYTLLPMSQLAAKDKDNLCDLQCEEYILRKMNVDFDYTNLTEEAKENRWLKEKGTPLHSVGKLLEQKGLSVVRRYSVSLEELINALKNESNIITVVNAQQLEVKGDTQISNEVFYHAIVVLNCNTNTDIITVFDPIAPNDLKHYSIKRFLIAWEDALNYMVTVKFNSIESEYNPQPINLDDIELSAELLELREAIAENAHDVWAAARKKEGWSYGFVRDDIKKQNPDLIPYYDLPDSEKQYDRDMAMNTIKLVKKLGYELIKTTNTELYKSLIGKLRQQEELFHCNECSAPIFKEQVYCEQCGRKLDYSDYFN